MTHEYVGRMRDGEFELYCPECEAQSLHGWQPIETAPKDGRFLVFGGEWAGELGGTNAQTAASMIDRDGGRAFYVADTEYYGPKIQNPTHWMPLPEPPK